MKKLFLIFLALFFVVYLGAQERTGRIVGKVIDEDGNPIPGATVTLFSTAGAPMSVTSKVEGSYRFLALPPSSGYALKCELEGFKTRIETEIVVEVGLTTELNLVMEIGTLEEEITVVAVSPVVDARKTSISTAINYETLQSLPNARDPWVLLQMTPSIQMDRENVGGNESGLQSSFVALGGSDTNNTWILDGIDVTDPAALGASLIYYDYDIFDEVSVTIGGAGVESQTSGVSLNLVTRRGGNKPSFAGRFYYTESAFQAKPTGALYEDLKKIFGEDAGYNKIRDIKDFGFNMGGPFLKDRIWWWASYGIQEIKTTLIHGSNDASYLNNYAGKLNIQIVPENRIELFIHASDKNKYGRSSSPSYPAGYNQHGRYHFGGPIAKIQVEHMFGDNFFISAKYGFTDTGFGLWPADDEELERVRTYDVGNMVYSSNSWYFSGRPNHHVTVHATYFNENLFAASHEIKMGIEYGRRWDTWTQGNAGNVRYNFNYNYPTVDWDGDGSRDNMIDKFDIDLKYIYIDRGTYQGGPEGARQLSAFLSDTATWGRLTLKLGLRYDYQVSYSQGGDYRTIFGQDLDEQFYTNYFEIQQNFLTPAVASAIGELFPGIIIPEVKTSDTVPWAFLSPRLGLTYDITGDGKTIAKLSGAIYGSRMASWPAYLWQQGGSGGWLRFWWHDADGNGSTAFNELYWADFTTRARTAYRVFDDNGNFIGDWERSRNLMWGGFDYKNPGATTDPYYIVDPDWKDEKTFELIAGVEREIFTNLSIQANFTWRRYQNWWIDREYADYFGGRLLERSDYIEAPHRLPLSFTTPDGEMIDMGDAAGKPFYVWNEDVNYVEGWYATSTPDDYYNIHTGLTLIVTKKLSARWMLNGSFTWQSQKTHWDKEYPIDPNNQWALDSQTYAYVLSSAAGKIGMPIFSRWMVKAQGLYQLPYDFNISFVFDAREGHILPQMIGVEDFDSPNPYSSGASIYRYVYGVKRLPTFWNLNMRLEKMLRVGESGRIYLMVDAFNVFNQNILLRQRDENPGTIYLMSDDPPFLAENSRSAEPNEVLNPRIFRFGVRFQF